MTTSSPFALETKILTLSNAFKFHSASCATIINLTTVLGTISYELPSVVIDMLYAARIKPLKLEWDLWVAETGN